MQGYIKVNHNVIKYCDNPINYTDPTGQCPWCIVGAIAGAGIDVAQQYIDNGYSMSNYDWRSTAVAAVSGSAGGLLGSITTKYVAKQSANLIWNTVGNGVLGTAQQITTNVVTNSDSCSDGVGKSTIQSAGIGLGATKFGIDYNNEQLAKDRKSLGRRAFRKDQIKINQTPFYRNVRIGGSWQGNMAGYVGAVVLGITTEIIIHGYQENHK